MNVKVITLALTMSWKNSLCCGEIHW